MHYIFHVCTVIMNLILWMFQSNEWMVVWGPVASCWINSNCIGAWKGMSHLLCFFQQQFFFSIGLSPFSVDWKLIDTKLNWSNIGCNKCLLILVFTISKYCSLKMISSATWIWNNEVRNNFLHTFDCTQP
jgi:hypothetical protein